MPRRLPGQEIDGFRLVEALHRGGMAVLWRVTHSAHSGSRCVMKVPLIAYGEGPGAIVGFEVEQMILPRLVGPARAALRRVGGFLASSPTS